MNKHSKKKLRLQTTTLRQLVAARGGDAESNLITTQPTSTNSFIPCDPACSGGCP